jgi:hypothetical protein
MIGKQKLSVIIRSEIRLMRWILHLLIKAAQS